MPKAIKPKALAPNAHIHRLFRIVQYLYFDAYNAALVHGLSREFEGANGAFVSF
jgi:hypothetical protein